MIVLGIETSCDETAAAVVRDGWCVLSNVIASQHDLHAEYGGVVPEIASRAHVERIQPVVERALRDAGLGIDSIDAVAVGHRPGLIGALLVGVASAKALAWSLSKPIVGVDHIQAHVYSGFLSGAPLQEGADSLALDDAFPALALVVSGGHTALFRCEDPLRLACIGSTIDDAVGEAYDKAAVILGLPHPGGPNLDALAVRGDERAFQFPQSRLGPESLDFSFSGLKTSLLYAVRGYPGQPDPPAPLDEARRADLAAGFQRAAVGVLMLKLERALDRARRTGAKPRSVLVGGGVSANSRLRAELVRFAGEQGLGLFLPPMPFCMDNAAMIAGLAWHLLRSGASDGLTLEASPSSALTHAVPGAGAW